MIVRLAAPTDAEQLSLLNEAFNGSSVGARQIHKLLADSLHEKTVVAEVDGTLAGFACLQIYTSWCYPEPWAELTELYVTPKYRRQGLGKAMVRLVEEIAKHHQATEIVLLTSEHNIAGQSTYRSCGYSQQAKCSFRKALK